MDISGSMCTLSHTPFALLHRSSSLFISSTKVFLNSTTAIGTTGCNWNNSSISTSGPYCMKHFKVRINYECLNSRLFISILDLTAYSFILCCRIKGLLHINKIKWQLKIVLFAYQRLCCYP